VRADSIEFALNNIYYQGKLLRDYEDQIREWIESSYDSDAANVTAMFGLNELQH